MTLPKLVIIGSHIPILAAVLVVAFRYSTFGKALRVFSVFVFLSAVLQFASLACWFGGINNMPLLHVYVAGGFVCLAWFYKTVLGDFISPFIMWGGALIFVILNILNSIFLQGIFTFNSNALVLESILLVILALFSFVFFLNDSMKETGIRDIRSLSWINSGIFIYYLSCLLLFYLGETIVHHLSTELNKITWIFHSFFSMVMYGCFIIGLCKSSKTSY